MCLENGRMHIIRLIVAISEKMNEELKSMRTSGRYIIPKHTHTYTHTD